MSSMMNVLGQATAVVLAQASEYTSDTNATGVDVSEFEGSVLATLDANHISGTTPTLDVKLQEADAQGGTYTDIPGAAFTQVTTTDALRQLSFNVSDRKRWIRAVIDVGGTSPVYRLSVLLVGLKKYIG